MPSPSAEKTRTNLMLGFAVLLFAALVAFVWIPLDVESGIFENVRRRIEIGDAFAPTLAAGLLGLGGFLLIVDALRETSVLRISKHSFRFVAVLIALFVLFMSVMLWTGPALVILFGAEGAEYRLLRDTVPWKYSGFIVAGTFLVTALISFVERRVSLQSILIGLGAALAMILLYDLPFDDLLLPPNGDF